VKNVRAKRQVAWASIVVALYFTGPALGQTSADNAVRSDLRIDQLIEESTRAKQQLAGREQGLNEYQATFERTLGNQKLQALDLEAWRGTGTRGAVAVGASAEDLLKPPRSTPVSKNVDAADRPILAQAQAASQSTPEPPATPAGQAPDSSTRPPPIAPIVDYPGVLTPKGRVVLEPTLELNHSSSNRVALVGFTIIPAITIGLIDIRSVSRDFLVASLAARYGLTNRFEIEVKVPYVYRQDSTTARPLNVPSQAESVFDASGHGLGDIEAGFRYQLNRGGTNMPFYVGSLRVKATTGKGPFEVTTFSPFGGDEVLQSELPTGTGFYAIQPGLTALLASDPAVFFGGVNYIWNVKRAIDTLDSFGTPIGVYDPGDGFGFNFGMGLSLNERASFSVGYDHVIFFEDKRNGETVQLAQLRQLGSLLIGYSFRLTKDTNLNLSFGVGVTDEASDVSITVRLPIML